MATVGDRTIGTVIKVDGVVDDGSLGYLCTILADIYYAGLAADYEGNFRWYFEMS